MRSLIGCILLISIMFSGHAIAGDPLQSPLGDASQSIIADEGDGAKMRGRELVLEPPLLVEVPFEPEVPAQYILETSPPFKTPWMDTVNSPVDDNIFDLGRQARIRMERQHAQFRWPSRMAYDPPEYQYQPPDYILPLLFWYPGFWFLVK